MNIVWSAAVNDTKEDAEELIGLAAPLGSHVNLIPVNPIKERDFVQSNHAAIAAFQKRLEKAASTSQSVVRMGRGHRRGVRTAAPQTHGRAERVNLLERGQCRITACPFVFLC